MVFGRRKTTTEDQFDWIPKDPQAARGGEGPGPRVLKSQASPLGTLIAALFVCLFWNGIVSVFVTFAVRSFIKGDPEWFLTIFITPFVLIGLLLFVWVAHSFLSLFNPRPVITMLTPELWLGGNLDIRWQFTGNASRIRQLKIQLVGQEKATYTRGTTTHTDTEEFATLPIVETDDPHSITTGHATLQIPLRTMHSFKSGNNEIAWSLLVHGDIKNWPDVSQRFALVVLPAPVTA